MATLATWTLVLMAAGGFIAWLGDRLGTRIGKKRLTLFGLRPRHTAGLATVASGVAIALVTLLTLLWYDASVRRALLHGHQIVVENRDLSRRNRLYRAQIAAAEDRLAPLTAQLNDARAALARQQQVAGVAEQERQTAQAALKGTQAQLADAQAGVQAAQASLAQAQAQTQAAQAETRRQQAAVASLSAQQRQLTVLNAGLSRATAQLAGRAEASRGDLLFRGRSLLLPEGQELGRVVVRTAQPVRTTEGQITLFLDTLSRLARSRGGKLGANGRAVAVAILPPGTDSPRTLPPDRERDAVRALAQNIAGQNNAGRSSVVIVAHTPVNSFRGEQSEVILRAYDNALVYADNTLVASQTINGAQSETAVLEDLQAFLTEQVRPAALKRGLIPQPDPLTGRPLVGAVDEATTLGLVGEIQQIGARARVAAFADGDITSSGPLRLRLTATPAP